MSNTVTASTVTDILTTDRTPPPVDIAAVHEVEYSDEQFYADLRKSKKQFDEMAKKAMKEDRQGKTRRFP